MSADLQVQSVNGIEFKVADLSLAEAGRKQIRLAEHEMPGLMALREEICAFFKRKYGLSYHPE